MDDLFEKIFHFSPNKFIEIDDFIYWQDNPNSFERKIYKAFCTSHSCKTKDNIYDVYYINEGYLKNVDKTAIHCPDCGYALFWNNKYEKKNDLPTPKPDG